MVSRVHERGPTEIVTQEAFQELEEAMKRGEIATIAQAHRFLSERGVRYAHPESVGGLLRGSANRRLAHVSRLKGKAVNNSERCQV